MRTDFVYKEGDRVRFGGIGFDGTGIIKGAGPALPVMGVMYIVEITSASVQIPNDTYPFSHMTIPENHIHEKL